MSETTTHSQIQPAAEAEPRPRELLGPSLSWVWRPLRDEPRVALTTATILLAMFVLVLIITEKVYLGGVAVLLGAICGWRNFVPMTFHINEEGVRQILIGEGRLIPWTAIRRLRISERGLLLLPEFRFGDLDALRGVFVPWGEHQDDVMKCIRFYVPYLLPKEKDETALAGEASTATHESPADESLADNSASAESAGAPSLSLDVAETHEAEKRPPES